MTEPEGHPSTAPPPPERAAEATSPLTEAAAALGFGGDAGPRAAEPGRDDAPTQALPPVPPAAPTTSSGPPERSTSPQPSPQPSPQGGASGVPPRPQPLPPPRPVRAPAGVPGATRPAPGRPGGPGVRPVARTRKAKLVLKRIDPWSVFLYSVVASIFIGIATLVAVGVLYAVLAKLGVLSSLNTFIGDITAESASAAEPSQVFTFTKVMTFGTLLAALNVVLITALSTLAAFLYNVCASLTGGIEVTLTDQA